MEESGNLPEGIRYYKERLNYDGSYQEKYIARLRLSRIYKNVQALDEAIKYAEEAEKMVPNRLEAYLEHMYCLDTQKKFKEAYLVGIRGLQHGRLNPTDLFVEYDVYDWKFLLHIMLMAHYSNNDIGAYNLVKKFMEEKKYPAWFVSQAESNFKIIEGKYLSSLVPAGNGRGGKAPRADCSTSPTRFSNRSTRVSKRMLEVSTAARAGAESAEAN